MPLIRADIDFPYALGANVAPKDVYGSVTVAQNIGPVVLVLFTIPIQVVQAFLVRFGQGIDDPTAWSSSTWSIRRNGVGVPDYSSITDQLAEFDVPGLIGPVPVNPGDVIDVVVTNSGVASHLYGARLKAIFDYQGPGHHA